MKLLVKHLPAFFCGMTAICFAVIPGGAFLGLFWMVGMVSYAIWPPKRDLGIFLLAIWSVGAGCSAAVALRAYQLGVPQFAAACYFMTCFALSMIVTRMKNDENDIDRP